ncbi:MAG TPA: amino acid adenylation domain-containing protein, partial [Herpetosiphonaceae bacterium]
MIHSTDTNRAPALDPARAVTLVELLRRRAEHQPDRPAYTFLSEGETAEVTLSYEQVDRRARAIAALLQGCATPGARALLLYPPGVEYICAFFGCLYAGIVAVPAYPPQSARLERSLPRLRAIVTDCAPTIALTTAALHQRLSPALSADPDFQAITWLVADDLADQAATWREPELDGATLAFLQYTSGSTAAPKGVMVSHANLLHNQRLIRQGFGHDDHATIVGWLPLYHDMGLIGNVLQPLYLGARCVLMSPIAFLQSPIRWLQAISRYRATTSGGPNFAYDLCVRKITPEQRATLDLSSWTVAFNGAEPVRAETLDRFAAAFAECGFRREAFYPCDGLAETTLRVSGGSPAAPPIVTAFAGDELEHRRVVERGADQPGARSLVGCGQVLGDQRVVVVDPETGAACRPGTIGEIWVSGSSVAQGYWNRPEASAQTFGARLPSGDGPFLRTGDLGFFHAGELFIAGRLKDLIIIRGRNYYPQDIELTVERSHSALRAGATAAFAVEIAGEERLIVAQEVERQHRAADLDAVAAAIRQAISEQHELQTHAILLLKPGSLPKTSSGKIQRHLCRLRFLDGELDALHQSTIAELPANPAPSLDRATLLAAPLDQRRSLIEAYLRDLTAQTVGVAPDALVLEQPLSSFGIDSLAAVELQHRVEIDLGVTIPMVQFLQGLSGTAIAQAILEGLASDAAPLAPVDRGLPLPLSFAQQRMWLLEQLTPGAATYIIPVALRLSGSLDPAALERSLIVLVERHESLRTTFSQRINADGSPVQVIAPVSHARALVSLPIIDLQPAAQEAEITRLATAEALRPFDLEAGLLLRTTLLKLAPAEYLLLLTAHHSIADGWSMSVVARDLAALYAAAIAGAPAALPELAIHYADFAVWQRAYLSGAVLAQQLSYWQDQFTGELPVLDLPSDRPRPAIQSFRGARETLTLPADLAAALKVLSRQHDATLFMTLLATFKLLLARWSGQRDIIVGTPISGRTRAQLEPVIGCFVNTLALRTDLSGDLGFTALLSRVRAAALGAYAHQDLPFEMLLEALNLDRDPSRTPLFQVFFNMLDVPSRRIERGGLRFEMASQPDAAVGAKFDITLYAQERDAAIDLEMVYNADLFDPARMVALLRQFQHLLEQIVARSESSIERLTLVTSDDRALLPDPQTPLPAAWSGAVHRRFAEQARRTPQQTALIDSRETWSYAELDDLSDRLAARLNAAGIEPQDLVAIYAHRSAALAWALLGVLKAGAAFVILDPAYPALRLVEYLRIARPRGWVEIEAAGALPDELAQYLDALCLSCRLTLPGRDAAQDLFSETEVAPGVTASPDDLAYVAFTSGSTGAPRAICGTHRPLAHFLDWQAATFGLTAGERFSLLSGLAHDPLLRDVFAPLTIGATLCIPAPELLAEPQQLARWLDQEQISVAHLTPAHGQLLAAAISDASGSSVPVLSSLRYAFFGGDRLSQRVISRFQALAPQATCVNCYGATETPQVMGYYVVDPAGLHSSAAIPLGRGIDGAQLLILNQAGQLAGVGELGEIAIRTPYLALGYLDDAALTEARFMANPFVSAADPFDRLYRTGDLGRYLPDGTVAFAGRADDQVKVRGFRVEPGEIESALKQHPDVRDAVVVVREISGETRLVAYVTEEQRNKRTKEQNEGQNPEPRTQNLEPNGEQKNKEQRSTTDSPSPIADEAENRRGSRKGGWGDEGLLTNQGEGLFSFLQSCLPSYMLPSAFVLLDALPLTPNGKLDRRALPEPDSDQLPETAHVPPRTPTEEIVAAIWAEVLDRTAVGVHDNFFSLGGHSLLAARLMARLRAALNVDLPLRTLFEAPTVASLSQVIERRRGGDAATEVVLPGVVVDPQRRGEPFPLTDIQQAYWIGRSQAFELGNVSTHTYLELEAIELDLPRFNHAWLRLIERHEMLRAIVRADGRQQILLTVPDYPIQALDLRDQDAAAQATQIAAIRERRSHQ